jgi:uroporphyrinogen-III decarboxylase
MIPYLFTEGKYTSRLKFLKQLPKGKTLVHFEQVDMGLAKKELEGIACVTGNFPAFMLINGTRQQVIDETKRQLDACAPGGGYIFSLDGSFVGGKRENVEALYETIKTYGKY